MRERKSNLLIQLLIYTTCIIGICNTGSIELADNLRNIQSGPRISSTLERELEEISLDQFIISEAEKRLQNAGDIYLIDAGTHEKLKTEDFLRKSYSLAAELQALGCNNDTVVGIISENRLEYPIVILAALLAGATFTGFTPGYTVRELAPIYNITKPKIVFCALNHCEKLMHVAADGKIEVIVLDWASSDASTTSNVPPGRSFSQLSQSRRERIQVKNSPNAVAGILYSSGTTGLSKGVMLTHKNLVFILKLLQGNLIENNGPMNMCLTLMCHISGFNALLGAIVRNETLVIMQKRYTEGLFLSAIQTYKVKRTLLTPGMITYLLTNPLVDKYDLSSVEFITCGSAPISAKTEAALKEKFHLRYIQQMYGMTESTMYTLVKDPRSPKEGTCGSPVPGVQVKVVDLETGEILGKESSGEIYISGPSIAKGYFNNIDATAETIDADGWLHSGDIGFYDNDGDFFIVDRIKELLKVEDLQVAPAEIEDILLEHPAVAEAAVVGIPDKMAGQVPKAFIVKKNGVQVKKEELIEFVGARVLQQKRLKGGLEFIDKIPKNTTGKIMRRRVLEEWLAKNPESKT